MNPNDKNEIYVQIYNNNDNKNKKIYFIYNINESDISSEIFNPNKFKICGIIINFKNQEKLIENCNYFIPEEIGIYNITLNFKEPITDCSYMFYNCEDILEIDLSNFNSNKVNNMASMFNSCKKLNKLTLGKFNTINVKSLEETFANCESLKIIDISSFDTKNVKFINLMFDNCKSLKQIIFPKDFNLENVINMGGLFYNCIELEEIDLSGIIAKKVEIMSRMFYGCINLKKINFGKEFYTSNVKTMDKMFYQCNNLKDMDITNFDINNCKNLDNMFFGCENLESLEVKDNFL